MSTANRILFIPGKNPKPPVDEHRQQLLRCLLRGVGRADPVVARQIEADGDAFRLIGWNPLYYQSYKPLDEDFLWIDRLLSQDGPTHEDVNEALSFRRRTAWLLYTLADIFNFLIPLLPDPAVKSTVQETARYFSNEGNIGQQVRELLKAPLRDMFARDERVMIIGHSMGSVIAYDALWELTHIEKNPGRVDLFLTIGSPLGMRFTQQRLLGWHEQGKRRYPHDIRHWINMASQGDLTALDPTLRDDFRAMLELGVVQSLTDVNGGIFNYFRNAQGLNVHRSYGYLVNPRLGEVVARWWKEGA
ncbi:MAG: hypothetical protein HY274_07835 [Gammaproteobacteria bacterium]|nr:hypothetical protein [Gammaproteobacteria bacterium]